MATSQKMIRSITELYPAVEQIGVQSTLGVSGDVLRCQCHKEDENMAMFGTLLGERNYAA